MSYLDDIAADKLVHSFTATDTATGAQLTVTISGVTGRSYSLVKVDASYSVSTVSGLLTVTLGGTTIGQKYVHGAGALDFATDIGHLDQTGAQDFACVLDSGGGGVVGTITATGFHTAIPN